MKKNILYVIILAFALSGCKKESLPRYEVEKSFSDPSVKLEDFKKALVAGTDGFRMIITPSEGGLVGGYIKFDGTASAKVLLDNTVPNATTPIDNAYSIKVNKTNSVLALGETSPFAIVARAIGSVDTTYSYKNTVGDTLKLVGDLFGTKLSLIKVSKKDGDEYIAGKMGQTITAINSLKGFAKYFKRLTTGGKSYDVMFNTSTKTATFTYAKGTAFTTFTTPMIFINNGVEFTNPLVDGTNKIKSLNDLVINAATSTATLTVGAEVATLTNEIVPVIYDMTAPATFYNNPPNGSYWVAASGFTIDGVADSYGVSTIPSFSFLLFYPKYQPSYSRLGFIVGGAYAAYGPALVASFPTTGIIKFTSAGSFGTAPTAIRPIVTNTTNKFLDTGGFYVIKTGAATYDLVSVANAGAWMSFQGA